MFLATLRRWTVRRILAFLTRPLPRSEPRVWNDPSALARHIRKGDVLLVEGDNRISVVIQYLTQSCWSHAALYIGDELLRRGGPRAEKARAAFGEQAGALLVEALPDGVVASPIGKYLDHNIRIARPHRLRPEHRKTIVDDAVAAIGWRYDLRNVLDLARYLLPVRIVPHRLRRAALHLGSGRPTEVICSSLLGQLFAKVRFPILPRVEQREGELAEDAGPAWLRRIFRMRHPTLLTPRDFDLSPYFEIVKFNVIAGGGFDYQRIQWAEGDEDEALAAAIGDATLPLRGGSGGAR